MLFMVEGSIHRSLGADGIAAIHAWLGPMVDGGFVQNGYINVAQGRVWMIVTSPDVVSTEQRLNDLPVVRDGSFSFTTTPVSGLRFT